MKNLFIASVFVLLILTCGGSAWAADTHPAASCSAANVQSAINASATGDLVTIPAGTCAWGGTVVTIPGSKTITVQGAGIGVTMITSTATNYAFGVGTASRITGIEFTVPSGTAAIQYEIDLASSDIAGYRVDHCKFSTSTAALSDGVRIRGGRTIRIWGVVDNCDFNNARVLTYSDAWCDDYVDMTYSVLGLQNQTYVESNTFNMSVINTIDQNCGASTVFRFNTENIASGGVASIDIHSNQGPRGSRSFEFYGNTITAASTQWVLGMIRGGTGVIFNNTMTGAVSGGAWALDNVRSFNNPTITCDGTASKDGNTSPIETYRGYPCRDQIGRGVDAFLYTGGSWPSQALAPAYFWNTTVDGAQSNAFVRELGYIALHIVENRDFYNYNASFNGTAGVGVGTLASRSATCTTGVGYWATDQGSWNLSGSGGQGVLYKCTATDTWTAYYTPYTYPHPIRGVVTTPSGIEIIYD